VSATITTKTGAAKSRAIVMALAGVAKADGPKIEGRLGFGPAKPAGRAGTSISWCGSALTG
jgi:hypothetical protein